MEKKRLLICGATGFIGRNLADLFCRDDRYEVTCTHKTRPPFDLPGARWLRADLTVPADVERALEGQHIVVQAAASTSGIKDVTQRPSIHITDNAVMNSYVFRYAFEKGLEQVVFFSCSVMYAPGEKPVREDDFDGGAEITPKYFGAGWTKVYLEKMAEFYSRQGKTRFAVLRHSNVYGPHDKFDLERSHVFGATVAKVLAATGDAIDVWGDGEEARDLMHVSDLASAVKLVLERQKDPYLLINLGSETLIKIKDLVARIIKASGKDLMIKFDRTKPTIPVSIVLDCAKAKGLLGWSAQKSLDVGIAETLDWLRGAGHESS